MITITAPPRSSRRGYAASGRARAWIVCAVLLATLSSWIAPPAMAMAMMGFPGKGFPGATTSAQVHDHRHAAGDPTEHHVRDDIPAPCPATGCLAMGCGFATLDPPAPSAVRIVWTRVIQTPPADEIGRGRSVPPPLRPPRHA